MSCWETSAPGSGRALRRVAAVVVGVAAVLSSSSIVEASAPLTPAEKAAQEIQAARDRADAAAQALFDTESEIDRLEIEIGETEDQLEDIEAEVAAARSGLEQQAVRNFVGAGGSNMPLLIDITDTNDSLTAEVYSSVATENVYVDIDDFDVLLKEADETREELERQQAEAETATENFAVLIEQAEAEVVLLGQIEAQRLEDEAVREALAAQERARAEQARQEEEAAAAERAAAAAAQAATAATPSTSSGSELPEQVTPQAAPQASGSSLACPVAGPRAFADTWGAPRSGGRSHQGVDIISPTGTPLVAMESGRVEFRSNALGGLTLRLYGDSGTRYYYAHLSSYEGSNRTVSKGEVVGYNGSTGNTTTPHLHLQIHPNGGQPVNPYPATRAACG